MQSFNELIQFEWLSHRKRLFFYLQAVIFLGVGFLFGAIANFSMPMVDRNSPYAISLTIGIFSLGIIFAATISGAQSLLRERDFNFDPILYTTPLTKSNFLLSRFIVLFGVATFSFFMLVVGLMVGHQMPWLNNKELGIFNIWNYLQPFILFALPNILLCCAVLCFFAWSFQNKIVIYIGGLMIYVIYVAGSIFSNSPVIAGASPASPEAVSIAAKLDPFGLAALFEQTKYWSASDKNAGLLQLKDNLLFNRILWLSISSIFLTSAIYLFKWRREPILQKQKKAKREVAITLPVGYSTMQPTKKAAAHFISTITSFVKLEFTSVVRGTPFKLILIIWTFLLGIELFNAIEGGVRVPSFYPTTGLVLNTILNSFPLFGLLVILFYSSELLHSSRTHRINALEESTPYSHYAVLVAKNITLSILIFSLIGFSIIIGITTQLILGFSFIQLGWYLSLFYYLGLPLLLCVALVIVIQVPFENKYLGLFMASIVSLIGSSSLGQTLLGLNHPLLRFAPTMPGIFSDLNHFDNYSIAFSLQLMLAFSMVILLSVILVPYWSPSKREKIKGWRLTPLVLSGLTSALIASFIFYQTNIKSPYYTDVEITDIRQSYEQNYRKYAGLVQPIISSVNFSADLFPDENRYVVSGTYLLYNNSAIQIDSLLVYLDDVVRLQSMEIKNAKLISNDARHGSSWYVFSKPMQPGDSIDMKFEFDSSWNPFNKHLSFNSILTNGAFIRISDYFPAFGYQPGNEIKNPMERDKRNLPGATEPALLESPKQQNSDMIYFNATISTNLDQTVVCVGQLDNVWTVNDRKYFTYSSPRPVPFRLAISSARYAVKQDEHLGTKIEVFYHPDHATNVDNFLRYAKNTLTYCINNFGPYHYPVIRFVEISKFAEGFAGTAYPTTVFLNEDYAFNSKIIEGGIPDVVNELAGHELSHEWWGADQIVPDGREGSRVLSETLAEYTESMLTKKLYGLDTVLQAVAINRELYLSSRGDSQEKPLYKAPPNQIHLFYGKGAMVMYQLSQIIGEDSINVALRSLVSKYSYPNSPPTTLDLLQELYNVTPESLHIMINERFKKIVTYDASLDHVVQQKSTNGYFAVKVLASINKFEENGYGAKTSIPFNEPVELEFYFEGGKRKLIKLNHISRLDSTFSFQGKVSRVVLDPRSLLIDLQIENNERVPSEN